MEVRHSAVWTTLNCAAYWKWRWGNKVFTVSIKLPQTKVQFTVTKSIDHLRPHGKPPQRHALNELFDLTLKGFLKQAYSL